MTEEIKDVETDTSVRIEYQLDEFIDLVKWYKLTLEHIADTQPEGLYRVKDGKLAVPSAVMDVFKQALELDASGDIDLDSASI